MREKYLGTDYRSQVLTGEDENIRVPETNSKDSEVKTNSLNHENQLLDPNVQAVSYLLVMRLWYKVV